MNWLAYVVFSLAAVYLVLLIVTKILKTRKELKYKQDPVDNVEESAPADDR